MTTPARPIVATLVLALAGIGPAAAAVAIGELIGEHVEDLHGDPAGFVQEFIVDVNAGRVLYMVVRGGNEAYIVPVSAIRRVSPARGAASGHRSARP